MIGSFLNELNDVRDISLFSKIIPKFWISGFGKSLGKNIKTY